MSASGIPLQALLVIDNSVLVMLHEYCCERRARQVPTARLVPTICQWMGDQIDILKRFTPDGLVHCTDGVISEFRPWVGRLSRLPGIAEREYRTVRNHVCSLIHPAGVDPKDVVFLRGLPTAPRKLVGPGGLNDNDFSLVVLALQLTVQGGQVYVLTADQDLLRYVTWLRTRTEARDRWGNARLLQALQCLTYLELIHRSCKIQTEQMEDLISFCMVEHYSRTDLAGTEKGKSIFLQFTEIQKSLVKSVLIKAAAGGSLP